jgi:hypothetical protein
LDSLKSTFFSIDPGLRHAFMEYFINSKFYSPNKSIGMVKTKILFSKIFLEIISSAHLSALIFPLLQSWGKIFNILNLFKKKKKFLRTKSHISTKLFLC